MTMIKRILTALYNFFHPEPCAKCVEEGRECEDCYFDRQI